MADSLEEAVARLAAAKSPNEVLSLRPSNALSCRLSFLLQKSKLIGLNAAEQAEWERYELVEHAVRRAKTAALLAEK